VKHSTGFAKWDTNGIDLARGGGSYLEKRLAVAYRERIDHHLGDEDPSESEGMSDDSPDDAT
jgi:hypothetical protein